MRKMGILSMFLISPVVGGIFAMAEVSDRLKKGRLSNDEAKTYLFERLSEDIVREVKLDENNQIKSEDYYTFLLTVYVEKIMYKDDEFSRLFDRVMVHSYQYEKDITDSQFTAIFRMSIDFKLWYVKSRL